MRALRTLSYRVGISERAIPTVGSSAFSTRLRNDGFATWASSRWGGAISIALALSIRQTPARARDTRAARNPTESEFARFARTITRADRRGSAIPLAPIGGRT